MLASLAGVLVVTTRVACGGPPQAPESVVIDVGPIDTSRFSLSGPETPVEAPDQTFPDIEPVLQPIRPFGPASLADPSASARFRLQELVTPSALAGPGGNRWGGEVSFAAPSETTGLGFDLSFTPRASIAQDRAGNNVMTTGAELKLGLNLADRDLRGSNAAAPSWYFFVGADNEALVWNFGDQRAMDGASLRDQATVGDLQTGIAMSTGAGAQLSLGLVERKLEFNDVGGDQDVNKRERFAALSFTLHH